MAMVLPAGGQAGGQPELGGQQRPASPTARAPPPEPHRCPGRTGNHAPCRACRLTIKKQRFRDGDLPASASRPGPGGQLSALGPATPTSAEQPGDREPPASLPRAAHSALHPDMCRPPNVDPSAPSPGPHVTHRWCPGRRCCHCRLLLLLLPLLLLLLVLPLPLLRDGGWICGRPLGSTRALGPARCQVEQERETLPPQPPPPSPPLPTCRRLGLGVFAAVRVSCRRVDSTAGHTARPAPLSPPDPHTPWAAAPGPLHTPPARPVTRPAPTPPCPAVSQASTLRTPLTSALASADPPAHILHAAFLLSVPL